MTVKESIYTFWENLNERDRLVLSIGSVVVIIYLFYLIVYSPLLNAVDEKSEQLISKKETLAWMKTQEKIKQAPIQKEGNLLLLFSNQLKQTDFSQFPYQLQQAGEKNIQLSFDAVPYVDFINWLRKLNQQNQFNVVEMGVDRTTTPGVVKMRLLVKY